MALYIIAIGGTGAKCVESIVHLAAVGLFRKREPINILFLDQDAANGNVDRTRKVVEIYRDCFQLLSSNDQDWIQTPIEIIGDVWAPVTGQNQNLENFFEYNNLRNNEPELKHLFDVLYSEEERKTPLQDGFRGRPAIGSAVIGQVDLTQEPWSILVEKLQSDSEAKVFLCGSVFGGTGASGLPTVSRLIANLGRPNVKIGGLLMLPYFKFPPKEDTETEIYAKSEDFWLNTEVSLIYYSAQAQNQRSNVESTNFLGFDTVYLLGTPRLSQVSEQFKLGRGLQENRQHFIELYAGLAARHFLENTPTSKVVMIGHQESESVTWNDLPEAETAKKKLVNATRFAVVWTTSIFPELDSYKNNIEQLVLRSPWVEKFFRIPVFTNPNLPELNDMQQESMLEAIRKWSKSYLEWLGTLHDDKEYNIKLFNNVAFPEFDEQDNRKIMRKGMFADLLDETGGKGGETKRDTIQRLKNQLNPLRNVRTKEGVVGLAKALYELCQIA